MCTLLTNMIPLSIPLSSCALKMGCSHELAYVDTSILEAYFFGMRADTFCCISLASPLSPFCCIRATLFVASLSHITLPLLRVRPPTCRPIHKLPQEQCCCCCSLCHAVLSCLSTAVSCFATAGVLVSWLRLTFLPPELFRRTS